MTDTKVPRRGRLSKLSKLMLLVAIPVFCLTGFAIWVHRKTAFTPDFLDKHGFTLVKVIHGPEYDYYVYESQVPLAKMVRDVENEMTNRGFEVTREDYEDASFINIFSNEMQVGYLIDDQGLEFHQMKFHGIRDRIQLATNLPLRSHNIRK